MNVNNTVQYKNMQPIDFMQFKRGIYCKHITQAGKILALHGHQEEQSVNLNSSLHLCWVKINWHLSMQNKSYLGRPYEMRRLQM